MFTLPFDTKEFAIKIIRTGISKYVLVYLCGVHNILAIDQSINIDSAVYHHDWILFHIIGQYKSEFIYNNASHIIWY